MENQELNKNITPELIKLTDEIIEQQPIIKDSSVVLSNINKQIENKNQINKDTENKINDIRSQLGLPPSDEIPSSIKTEQEAINKHHQEKLNIEALIKNASELSELYKILKEAGGIQGSEKFYATDEVWQGVNAFVNNKAEETVITRTGGLREKVKELKKIREEKLQKQNPQNIEKSSETKENSIKQVGMEEWKRTLPDVHSMAEFSFRDFNPTYYLDDKGDHYVIYTEDGKRQGRKLYVAAQNAGMSINVEPSEIEKR